MRAVLNLSLPPKMTQAVKKRAKEHGFANTSEYVRFLLGLDTELITADELAKMARRADREYKAGRLKKMESLAELL